MADGDLLPPGGGRGREERGVRAERVRRAAAGRDGGAPRSQVRGGAGGRGGRLRVDGGADGVTGRGVSGRGGVDGDVVRS